MSGLRDEIADAIDADDKLLVSCNRVADVVMPVIEAHIARVLADPKTFLPLWLAGTEAGGRMEIAQLQGVLDALPPILTSTP